MKTICLSLLVLSILFTPLQPSAETIAVRHVQGSGHGFLVLRTLEGSLIATGDLTQMVTGGNRIKTHLVFRFKDGSVDDESAVFTQRGDFRLLSDHHIQSGPSYPHPIDLKIDASGGRAVCQSGDDAKPESISFHSVPDLYNGMLITVLTNLPRDFGETDISYIAATPKPRMIRMKFVSEGGEPVRIGFETRKATRYTAKISLGGIIGVVTPLVGMQPPDSHVWILEGDAPTLLKFEGPLYEGGPPWRMELASPEWPSGEDPEK